MLQRFFQPNKVWQRAGDDVGGDVLEHDLCVKNPAGAGWVVGWILVWSAFDLGPRVVFMRFMRSGVATVVMVSFRLLEADRHRHH